MSGQLKEVRIRIQAVKSTQQITKAMKLVAASKLRRAQDRIIQMRPYSAKLFEMLGNMLSGASASDLNIGYAQERPAEKVLLIVLTSDRGLCGAFNSNISKMVRLAIQTKYAKQKAAGNVHLLCIGKKGYEALRKETGLQINIDHLSLFSTLSFEESSQVSEWVLAEFLAKNYDVVEVYYNQFKNQITQIPTVEQYLPIQKLEPQEETATSKTKPDFIYQPNQADIITELVPKILKTRFFRFLLDSNASEHGARMTSMDNATNNADDLLRDLTISYNRVRQAAITTEITEIVGGAAALQG